MNATGKSVPDSAKQTGCSPHPARSAIATSSSRYLPAGTTSCVGDPDANPCAAVALAECVLGVAADKPPKSARQMKRIYIKRPLDERIILEMSTIVYMCVCLCVCMRTL